MSHLLATERGRNLGACAKSSSSRAALRIASATSGLQERLADGVLLLDGGMGSLLIGLGLESGRASEVWTAEQPRRVASAHRAYLEAGSDVIHTNTFGATPAKLEAAGLGGRCRELNAAAVALARRAASAHPRTLVAGDVGPTGKLLPPMGDASEELFRDQFRDQTAVLAEAGADLISIETMYDLREARAAVAAAAETGLPVIASMTFEARPRGNFTIMGDRVAESLGALAEAGAAVVGINCSVVSGDMIAMVREAATLGLPVAAQPNAGKPRATAGGVAYDDASPAAFARDLVAMVDAGARLVGGCCGTDPEFIRQARQALDRRPARSGREAT